MNDGTGVFLAACLVVAGITFYFLPTIVSISRKTANGHTGIVLLNLFLGWTLIGWIAALIWACTAETQSQAQLREMAFANLAQLQRPPAPPPAPSAAYELGRTVGTSPAKVLLGVFAICVALVIAGSIGYHLLTADNNTPAAATHTVSAQ